MIPQSYTVLSLCLTPCAFQNGALPCALQIVCFPPCALQAGTTYSSLSTQRLAAGAWLGRSSTPGSRKGSPRTSVTGAPPSRPPTTGPSSVKGSPRTSGTGTSVAPSSFLAGPWVGRSNSPGVYKGSPRAFVSGAPPSSPSSAIRNTLLPLPPSTASPSAGRKSPLPPPPSTAPSAAGRPPPPPPPPSTGHARVSLGISVRKPSASPAHSGKRSTWTGDLHGGEAMLDAVQHWQQARDFGHGSFQVQPSALFYILGPLVKALVCL